MTRKSQKPSRMMGGGLTPLETRVTKSLLARGWRNQDIQNLINIGRKATINNARVTEVKKGDFVTASEEEVDRFLLSKYTHDPVTGLNAVDDEALIKARDAMSLAVEIFNSPRTHFKAETFSVLANIAWTYLVTERAERQGLSWHRKNGTTCSLSDLVKDSRLALSEPIVANLQAIKNIRDATEHRTTGPSDKFWYPIFQACCLNFEEMLVKWFGDKVSLYRELALAIQFRRLTVEQLSECNNYAIPKEIQALDGRLNQEVPEEIRNDIAYRFKVVYMFDSVKKGDANFRFIRSGSDEHANIHNVLVKEHSLDERYPYLPAKVVELVQERIKPREFKQWNHTCAYKKFKVRPFKNMDSRPNITDKDYCIYHVVHKNYTYNDAWVNRIVEDLNKNNHNNK